MNYRPPPPAYRPEDHDGPPEPERPHYLLAAALTATAVAVVGLGIWLAGGTRDDTRDTPATGRGVAYDCTHPPPTAWWCPTGTGTRR
jgi:hypothetical protein